MERHIFMHLCEELTNHGLSPSKNITVQEQVAMFLMILAHSNSARDNAEDFQHSTATVSKYFGIVLKAVISMSRVVSVPPNMMRSQDCVGAIDGVHVDAIIPNSQQIPFRGRKGNTTQNVLCVCSFDMRFTYVVAGWEGSAHDSRILTSTATDRNSQFPMPPLGMVAFFFFSPHILFVCVCTLYIISSWSRKILRCGFWICKRTWISSTIPRIYFSFPGD
ncbi:hypothetical protein LINPERPRIM_LOCUS3878 [Linum perenne]